MAIAVNSTSIQVSWMSPLCPNGIITHYRLYYRQTDTRQTANINISSYSIVDISSSLTKHIIPNLSTSQSYGFLVQAFTGNVSGVIATEELATTSSRPGKKYNIALDSFNN